jgi:hypothetical protein
MTGYLWYKRVLPVGLAHATTLALGNAVYLYLQVGFIQVPVFMFMFMTMIMFTNKINECIL